MPLSTNDSKNIPQEADIFFKSLSSFIPKGKTWDTLTPQEQEEVKNKYRFSSLIPGEYQAITGINNQD